MIFRKKQPDPNVAEALARFAPVAATLDRAQRALLLAIPTARHPGAPLGEALDAFGSGLRDVEALMPAWRLPVTEEAWTVCAASLARARREAEALRANPPGPTEFELLNGRVGDVLEPLEDFAEAERSLRRKR